MECIVVDLELIISDDGPWEEDERLKHNLDLVKDWEEEEISKGQLTELDRASNLLKLKGGVATTWTQRFCPRGGTRRLCSLTGRR